MRQKNSFLKFSCILRNIIIENNLLSQDKCAKLFSPTQILKKHIKMLCCVKYEQKTSSYPNYSPSLGENDGKFISTWNFGIRLR